MFGLKKIAIVGGGAAAVMYATSHGSAVADIGNGVQNVQNGYSTVQNGVQSVQNGVQNVQNGYSAVQNGLGSAHDDGSAGKSGPTVSIQPGSAKPGQQVTIILPTCIQPTTGTAQSSVFVSGVQLSPVAKGTGLSGIATIRSDAQNGSDWTVRATCGSGATAVSGSTTITIYGGMIPPTIPPSRGPAAGGGGSVAKGDIGMTTGGIALVAGGIGYGLWTMRKRDLTSGTHVG